jgi:hypothetical protein
MLEHDERRNTPDLKPLRRLRRAIGIDLGDEHLPLILGRDRVHSGRHHLARPTPVRIKVDHDGNPAILDRPRERLIR